MLDYALRKATGGKEEELGFTILPRKSRRYPKQVLTDLDFADDISLLSDEINQAQTLLSNVERECKKVGLGINAKKTKGLPLNVEAPSPLQTLDGTKIDWVDDFNIHVQYQYGFQYCLHCIHCNVDTISILYCLYCYTALNLPHCAILPTLSILTPLSHILFLHCLYCRYRHDIVTISTLHRLL